MIICIKSKQCVPRYKIILVNGLFQFKNAIFVNMTPERTERLESVLAKRQTNLTVVLENVSDPHNISAVMRTCDAVGIQEIYILNTIIPRHKKWGAKSSSSAAKWLTIHQFTEVAPCFEALRKKYQKIYTTHLSTDAVGLHALNLTQPVALVFGNEHSGVCEALIAMADGNFIIPQVGIIKSLNISVACAVSLYEAYRQKELAGHYLAPQLEGAEMAELRRNWGFLDADETIG
jgi:tRNA (guanosine-2'-O-)-methyltransferase